MFSFLPRAPVPPINSVLVLGVVGVAVVVMVVVGCAGGVACGSVFPRSSVPRVEAVDGI